MVIFKSKQKKLEGDLKIKQDSHGAVNLYSLARKNGLSWPSCNPFWKWLEPVGAQDRLKVNCQGARCLLFSYGSVPFFSKT